MTLYSFFFFFTGYEIEIHTYLIIRFDTYLLLRIMFYSGKNSMDTYSTTVPKLFSENR